jgi:PII-like signaling protein
MEEEKLPGRAKILRIFIDEGDLAEDGFLYDAILKKAHQLELAGATVFKGFKGYGGPAHFHRLDWSGNPAEHPIMVTIVDTEEKISKALPELEELVGEGLIVLSDAEVIQSKRARLQ